MKKAVLYLLFLLVPFAAHASIVSDTIPEGNGKLATVRYHFEEEVPAVVAEVLEKHGYADVCCVVGLALERLILEVPKGQEGLSRTSDALMVLERNGERTLVGMRWNAFTGESWLADYGAMGLDLSVCSMAFHQDGLPTRLEYALTVGENTFYLEVTGQNLWYIRRFGDVVWNETNACFELEDGRWPACWTGCLEYRNRFADFPQTAADAKALAAATWAGMDLSHLAWLGGNLRTEPTAQSESYGNCYPGVLGQVLAQRMGASAPWYQVRVGDTVGWMSSPYVTPVTDWNTMAETRHNDLPVARTHAETCLMARPVHGEKVCDLPAGAVLQVLSRREDGWLHVCLPSGIPMRWMDVHGTFGYLHESSVSVAGSLKALP